MQFRELAAVLAQLETISSRLAITQVLSELWSQLAPAEIWPTANLIQGRLRPPYEQLVFNLSEKMIARALVVLSLQEGGLGETGVSVDLFGQVDEQSLETQVRAIFRRHGDWGAASEEIHHRLLGTVDSQLDIVSVYQALEAIAQVSGAGSHQDKIDGLIKLWRQLDSTSVKIITRMVIGQLRLGFATMTILDSLSWTLTGSKAESRLLESLWQKKADVGLLAQSYLRLAARPAAARQAQLVADYQVAVGVPIVPALCQRLNSTSDIIDKVGPVIAEPKYDGLRIQIHIWSDHGQPQVRAFTRSLEDVSAMFPELATLAASLPGEAVIFDSEAVGFHGQTGEMLPFQETISRRRIHDIEAKARDIVMKFFVFDVLAHNGQDWLARPLAERKALLATLLRANPIAQVTDFITTNDPERLREYHQHQLQVGLEGMVAKGETSPYQSGRKGWRWVKIKEIEGTRGKLNDTLDLVVLGVYAGKGRRHDLGVGAILVGLPDQCGQLVTISKIGTGFSDDQLQALSQQAHQLQVPTPPSAYVVDRSLTPDIWLAPQLVAEIAADELTRSSVHTSGYGLRFPRLIKWRTDKTADQATTTAELSQITIDNGTSS